MRDIEWCPQCRTVDCTEHSLVVIGWEENVYENVTKELPEIADS